MTAQPRLPLPPSTPPEPRTPAQAALTRLAATQKRDEMLPLVAATEHDIRQAFATAQARLQPTLRAFEAAYRAEWHRLNDGRAEDEPPVAVPLIWLLTSGWQARIRQVCYDAAQTFAQASLTQVRRGQAQAARLGDAHAQTLVTEAVKLAEVEHDAATKGR